jgi:hypothetical protein
MKKSLASCLVAIVAWIGSSTANAFTDCTVTLNSIFTGDISGTGTYGLYLAYTYNLTTGGTVSNSGYVLLTNPAAANISAAAFAARVSGQSNITIRFQNSSGASIDAVCAPPMRGDVIGIFL